MRIFISRLNETFYTFSPGRFRDKSDQSEPGEQSRWFKKRDKSVSTTASGVRSPSSESVSSPPGKGTKKDGKIKIGLLYWSSSPDTLSPRWRSGDWQPPYQRVRPAGEGAGHSLHRGHLRH